MQFVGGAYIPDGGSRTFSFLLPHRHPLAINVRHRDAHFGGNPNFQEIWFSGDWNFKYHIQVEPGSQLETKLLDLIAAASCNTNAGKRLGLPDPPRKEDLDWLAERLNDRKSKW